MMRVSWLRRIEDLGTTGPSLRMWSWVVRRLETMLYVLRWRRLVQRLLLLDELDRLFCRKPGHHPAPPDGPPPFSYRVPDPDPENTHSGAWV